MFEFLYTVNGRLHCVVTSSVEVAVSVIAPMSTAKVVDVASTKDNVHNIAVPSVVVVNNMLIVARLK